MVKEFRKLRADEIDVRISRINKSYITLILYKDARVDQNILDETVGRMNWQKHYLRDNSNCVISIWDDEKKQWVEKEDVGTESYSEAEKGKASDAQKRSGYCWGIGRELYTSPNIQFKRELANITKDEKCYDEFYVKHISYDENGCIKELQIINNNTGVMVYENKDCQARNDIADFGHPIIDTSYQPKSEEDAAEPCTQSQVNYLKKLVGEDESKYLDMYKVNSLIDLTKSQASVLISKLR